MEYIALYQQLIGWVVGHIGNDKIAHVVVGLAIWLGSALLLRKPLHSLLPLAILGVAEAINEILDRIAYDSWRWADTSMDIVATFACPLLILLTRACVSFLPKWRATARSKKACDCEQRKAAETGKRDDPGRAGQGIDEALAIGQRVRKILPVRKA